jgi:putative aldouronate transport system substrate-binding protein
MKFILLCLIAGVFVSCGQGKGQSPQASAGGAAKISVEVFDRGTDGGKTDPSNNAWTDWIKAKVLKDEGLEITFSPVNRWQETTDIVTRMAAQNAPDLCYTYSGANVNNWGRQGGLYDLSPYVETLLKDMQDFMGEDPTIPGQNLIWHSKDVESNALYGLTNKYIYTASHNTFIRKDWLDALGLPPPATTEELYNALVAFKNNAAKLGPKVIPYEIGDVRWQAYSILLSFMPADLSFKERWINTVGERQLMIPGVKEAYRFLNKMFSEGLIDPDFPLYKDDTTPSDLMKSGNIGAFSHNWDQPYRQNLQIQTMLEQNVPGAKYIPIDPFTNSAGKRPKRGSPTAGGLQVFVPKTCKNPEAALKYANWLCRYENYNFLQFGNEGTNHTLVRGVKIPKPATGPWIQNSGVNIDYTMNINGYAVPPEQFGEVLASSYPGIPPEEIALAYEMSSTDVIAAPYVPAAILSIEPLMETLVAKENALSISLICAKPGDFDKVWDEGIKDWLASGAQAVIDEQRAKFR